MQSTHVTCIFTLVTVYCLVANGNKYNKKNNSKAPFSVLNVLQIKYHKRTFSQLHKKHKIQQTDGTITKKKFKDEEWRKCLEQCSCTSLRSCNQDKHPRLPKIYPVINLLPPLILSLTPPTFFFFQEIERKNKRNRGKQAVRGDGKSKHFSFPSSSSKCIVTCFTWSPHSVSASRMTRDWALMWDDPSLCLVRIHYLSSFLSQQNSQKGLHTLPHVSTVADLTLSV